MISREDDESDDPRRYRRSLVPLDIEDAETPPSIARRMAGIFRKKRAAGADGEDFAAGSGPEMTGRPAEVAAPPEGSLPEDLDRIPGDDGPDSDS